jgi:hypothetical protein
VVKYHQLLLVVVLVLLPLLAVAAVMQALPSRRRPRTPLRMQGLTRRRRGRRRARHERRCCTGALQAGAKGADAGESVLLQRCRR